MTTSTNSTADKHSKKPGASPVNLLEAELRKLRRELRETLRFFSARLEIQLAESASAVRKLATAEELSREQLYQLRDLTSMLRKPKLKPAKGRRKDLRKVEDLICELHLSLVEPSKA